MISWENYEEYMMMHADGELQPADEEELMAFIGAHPELKSELAAYNLTRLTPDETLVHPDKNSLLRTEPMKRTIAFPQWRKYAIAAGIAAIAFISFYKFQGSDTNTTGIVKTDTAKQAAPVPKTPAPVPNPPAPQQNIAVVPVRQEKTGRVVPRNEVAAPKHTPVVMPKIRYTKVVRSRQGYQFCGHILTSEQIDAVAMTDVNSRFCNNKTEIGDSVIPVPAFELSVNSRRRKRSFIDRLPIDESNKHQLKTITRVATGAYGGLARATQQIDEHQITFSVQDKQLKVSF